MAVAAMIGLALLESLPDGLLNRRAYVYSINDPRTGQPVYFGKTARSPRCRFSLHRREAKRKHSALYSWWRDIIAVDGLEPVMTVLVECDSDLEARLMESAIIWICRSAGLEILNTAKGGEGKAAGEYGLCRKHGKYEPGYGCPECKRLSDLKWYEANRDRQSELTRRRYERDREKKIQQGRKWYRANRERHADLTRKWYERNRERKAEKGREWYERNRERKAEKGREWREANRERMDDARRKWREANRERIAETNRRWSEANRERRSEQQRARRAKKKAEKLASTQARTEPTA